MGENKYINGLIWNLLFYRSPIYSVMISNHLILAWIVTEIHIMLHSTCYYFLLFKTYDTLYPCVILQHGFFVCLGWNYNSFKSNSKNEPQNRLEQNNTGQLLSRVTGLDPFSLELNFNPLSVDRLYVISNSLLDMNTFVLKNETGYNEYWYMCK